MGRLYSKYTVINNDTCEKVTDCFVLRPKKDMAARAALKAYARATDDISLAEDILHWIIKLRNVDQEEIIMEPKDDSFMDYIKGDIAHNVKAAVQNLRASYWSDDMTSEIADKYVEAEGIISSAVAIHDYTLQKDWIPVSKEPPKAPCIVTDAQGHVYGTRGLYTWIEGEKTVSVAIEIIMSEPLVYYGGAGDYDRLKDYIIVAWMPFPAAYKEASDGDLDRGD